MGAAAQPRVGRRDDPEHQEPVERGKGLGISEAGFGEGEGHVEAE